MEDMRSPKSTRLTSETEKTNTGKEVLYVVTDPVSSVSYAHTPCLCSNFVSTIVSCVPGLNNSWMIHDPCPGSSTFREDRKNVGESIRPFRGFRIRHPSCTTQEVGPRQERKTVVFDQSSGRASSVVVTEGVRREGRDTDEEESE